MQILDDCARIVLLVVMTDLQPDLSSEIVFLHLCWDLSFCLSFAIGPHIICFGILSFFFNAIHMTLSCKSHVA